VGASGLGGDADRVNIRDHQITERGIHEAVLRQAAQPPKALRGNSHAKMAAPILSPGVPGMQMAFVVDLQESGCKSDGQATPDGSQPSHGKLAGHGMTWMKGLTLASVQTPACM